VHQLTIKLKTMVELLIFIFIVAIYFLPTIICYDKSFGGQVFVLNFFLGWTFVGWVIALVWSLKTESNNN